MSALRRIVVAVFILGLMTTAAGSPAATALPDTYPKRPDLDVQEYVFRLRLSDAGDRIEGLTTIDLLVRAAGVTEVAFDLIGPAAGPGPGMHVDRVTLARGLEVAAARAPRDPRAGLAVPFVHRDDRLSVTLPTPTRAGERIAISVKYAGVPATGLIIGENKHGERTFFSDNWPNRARHWLPTIDHVYDKARSQMVVTAPAHYQVISNGLLAEETDIELSDEPYRITHWRQSVPIAPWLFVMGAARFAVQTLEPFDGKPVQTWVYAQDRDAGFYDFAVPTHDALRFYSERIGPYAYEKLANIQSNSVGGGMEAASAIFYGDDSVTGQRTVRWRNVIIHEIAHQWFGNAVTEYDWNDVWLSEGFATYFTLLFIEHAYGRDEFVDGLHSARERVLGFYSERPDYRIVHDNLDDMSQVTNGMTYQKGAWVLHMLREMIGTETFWRGIRLYYDRHFNGHATTEDFRSAMEEVSGRDLQWFFRQWLYQGRNPALQIGWRHDAERGEVELVVNQVQGGEALFRVPLTMELVGAEGSHRHRVEIPARASSTIRLAAPSQPLELRVDPDTALLARVTMERASGSQF